MTKTSEKFYSRLANELASELVRVTFDYVKFEGGMNELKERQKKALDLMEPEFTKIIRLAKRSLIIEAEIVPSMISTYNVMKFDCELTNTRLKKSNNAA